MARLSVNLNKIALLRNSRHTGVPSVIQFAKIALDAGVAGITVHPRPDQRHIRESDVPAIAEIMKDRRPEVEFNIEGYPDERFLKIISNVRPEQCTLVPDSPSSFTSEEGWKFSDEQTKILDTIIPALKKLKTRVILFIDPDPAMAARAADMGADGIEIYTGGYAAAFKKDQHLAILEKCVATAKEAGMRGLVVNVGHDLNLHNVPLLVSRIPFLHEASIGHELTADALVNGFSATIKSYSNILSSHVKAQKQRAPADPYQRFRSWYSEAKAHGIPKSEATVLATSSKKGVPSARVVFAKEMNAEGFVFFTNYESKKGRELAENPKAALLMHWPELERQVRISGSVKKISRARSKEYFHKRSRESQLSALASRQSDVLKNKKGFEEDVAKLRIKYEGKEVPLPLNWGGYMLTPKEFEFWEAGAARMHNRIRYSKRGLKWKTDFLFP